MNRPAGSKEAMRIQSAWVSSWEACRSVLTLQSWVERLHAVGRTAEPSGENYTRTNSVSRWMGERRNRPSDRFQIRMDWSLLAEARRPPSCENATALTP